MKAVSTSFKRATTTEQPTADETHDRDYPHRGKAWRSWRLGGSSVSSLQRVRDLFAELLPLTEIIDLSEAVLRLRQAYLATGIVGPASAADALHVALATVTGCRVIVSWNFRHIVHFQKIPLYNAVNMLHGYAPIAIHAPQEVIA